MAITIASVKSCFAQYQRERKSRPFGRSRYDVGKLHGSGSRSEELKKAMAVSEEKIQQRSRRRGQFSSSRFSLPESAQTLAGIAFRAAGKSVRNFPAASKFARKLFQQGLLDRLTATAFSSFLSRYFWGVRAFLCLALGKTGLCFSGQIWGVPLASPGGWYPSRGEHPERPKG